MKYCLTIFIVGFSFFGCSQSPELEWSVQINSPGSERSSCVVSGTNETVISTGLYEGEIDFDPGVDVFNCQVLASPGNARLYVQNLFSDGVLNWARCFNIFSLSPPAGLSNDSSGNLYVAGQFDALGWDIDPGPAEVIVEASSDAVIIKLSAEGDIEWANVFRGGTSAVNDIAIDLEGDILTTGYFWQQTDFDPGPDSLWFDNDNGVVFIHKMDTDGNLLWAKQVGDDFGSQGMGIAADSTGNVYVTGILTDTSDFDPGPGISILEASTQQYDRDIFVLKLDTEGDFIWVKQIKGAGHDWPHAIDLTSDGRPVVVGRFSDTCDFDPGLDTVLHITEESNEMFILQLDADGQFEWVQTMDEGSAGVAEDVFIDTQGNVHVTGSFEGNNDFDQGSGNYFLTSDSTLSDGFILTLNPQGDFIWAGKLGGQGYEWPQAIAVSDSGNLYCAGYFEGTIDLDPSPLSEAIYTATPSNFNIPDAFVLKLNMDSLLTSLSQETERTGRFTAAAYPNPGSGAYTVALGSTPQNIKIKVVDITGKTILTNRYKNTDSIYLNFEGENGIYLLHIITDDGNSVIKLVKQ